MHAYALQDEFRFDPVKEAEWEPFPSEWVEVDRIIAKRVRDPQEAMAMGLAPNQVEYLVKWKSMTYDGVSAAVAGPTEGLEAPRRRPGARPNRCHAPDGFSLALILRVPGRVLTVVPPPLPLALAFAVSRFRSLVRHR